MKRMYINPEKGVIIMQIWKARESLAMISKSAKVQVIISSPASLDHKDVVIVIHRALEYKNTRNHLK
jgi:hypothetical protein